MALPFGSDWRRALGELVLIVGGVLNALALDAWWQGREDRELERACLDEAELARN